MIQFINQYKRVIIRLLVFTLSLLLLYFVLNYSFITVAVESTDSKVELFTTNVDLTHKATIKPGTSKKFLIKRGTNLLTVRSTDKTKETRLPIKFKLFWSGSKSIKLEPQKKVAKVASSSFNCGLNNQDDVYNSYRCQGGSNIIRYDGSGDFPVNQVFLSGNESPFVQPQQYAGNLLALTYKNPEENTYDLSEISLQDSPQIKSLNISKYVGSNNLVNFNIGTERSSKTNKVFTVVNNKTNKLYIFKSISDQRPVEIDLLNGVRKDKLSRHQCTLSKDIVVCAYGRFDNDADIPEGSETTQTYDTRVSIYKASGERLNIRTIKESGVVDRFVFKDGYLALNTTAKQLIIYKVDGKKFDRIGETPGVEDVVFNQSGNLVVREENRLYTLKPTNLEAHLIYFSKNVRFSGFSSSYDNGYFVGFINNQSTNSLTAFKILSDDQKGDRIEDNLPTTYSDSVLQLDYSNDTLYIKIRLDSYKNNIETGEFVLDENDFNTKKQVILDQINQSGFSKNFKTIKFSY